MDEQGNIIIYQSEDGEVRLDVRLEGNTVWLTQQQMADLYGSSRTNIVEHIKHIYEEGELQENAICRKFRQVRQEGNREVSREIPYRITRGQTPCEPGTVPGDIKTGTHTQVPVPMTTCRVHTVGESQRRGEHLYQPSDA